ncbi:GroES-like protein [Hypoxylon argillaceum]|nr:GroES-like protein [Hypoxylon argillaceum]
MIPETQTAIIADIAGDLVVSYNVLVPELLPDMLLIKTAAVALNPVDTKFTGPLASEGAIAGGDCAGVVVAIGSGVPKGRFSIGDRVCAAVSFMDPLSPQIGAFAEYVGATADFTLKLPDGMPFEVGATLGISLATVGYALFRSLQIPGHSEKPAVQPAYVLIYGGSSATGTMAIQLVKRSGLIPLTTCSPKHNHLVEGYGAAKTFDYHDPSSANEIREYTKNDLWYALDCICEESSMQFCYAALGRAGGRYTTLLPYPQHLHTRKRVKPEWLLAPTLLGRRIGWPAPYNIEGDYEFLKKSVLFIPKGF